MQPCAQHEGCPLGRTSGNCHVAHPVEEGCLRTPVCQWFPIIVPTFLYQRSPDSGRLCCHTHSIHQPSWSCRSWVWCQERCCLLWWCIFTHHGNVWCIAVCCVAFLQHFCAVLPWYIDPGTVTWHGTTGLVLIFHAHHRHALLPTLLPVVEQCQQRSASGASCCSSGLTALGTVWLY